MAYPARPTHADVLAGYRAASVGELAARLGLATAELGRRIGISRSTFHRRQKDNARLTRHESDALARHSAILNQALSVFDGDEPATQQWLATGQVGLGGAVPLDLAQTSFGYREVEKLLTRIDHGVYA